MLRREITNKISFVLDELVPPILRDSFLFRLLAQRMLGDREIPIVFKDRFHAMSQAEVIKAYETIQPKTRETDLTARCVKRILQDLVGDSVLELGCGSGYLADQLSKHTKIKLLFLVLC